MKLFDFHHPFFRPLWRRYVVVGICFGWALLELSTGNGFWAGLFAALGALAVWNLFVVDWPDDDEA